MKTITAAIFVVLIATSAYAQEKGYVQGIGGLSPVSAVRFRTARGTAMNGVGIYVRRNA